MTTKNSSPCPRKNNCAPSSADVPNRDREITIAVSFAEVALAVATIGTMIVVQPFVAARLTMMVEPPPAPQSARPFAVASQPMSQPMSKPDPSSDAVSHAMSQSMNRSMKLESRMSVLHAPPPGPLHGPRLAPQHLSVAPFPLPATRKLESQWMMIRHSAPPPGLPLADCPHEPPSARPLPLRPWPIAAAPCAAKSS